MLDWPQGTPTKAINEILYNCLSVLLLFMPLSNAHACLVLCVMSVKLFQAWRLNTVFVLFSFFKGWLRVGSLKPLLPSGQQTFTPNPKVAAKGKSGWMVGDYRQQGRSFPSTRGREEAGQWQRFAVAQKQSSPRDLLFGISRAVSFQACPVKPQPQWASSSAKIVLLDFPSPLEKAPSCRVQPSATCPRRGRMTNALPESWGGWGLWALGWKKQKCANGKVVNM